MTASARPGSTRLLATWVWDQVCRHTDGIAVGSTVAALDERGALQLIAASDATSIGALRREVGGNPGFLQVAVRLLADQGWVTCEGDWGTDALTVEPTSCGRVVLGELAGSYRLAARFLSTGERIGMILTGAPDPAAHRTLAGFRDLLSDEWGLPPLVLPTGAREQVRCHLDGHVVAPVTTALARGGILRSDSEIPLSGHAAAVENDVLRVAFEILASQGWAVIDGKVARLTRAGEIAAVCARQYWHLVAYLPMLRRVPELLFGDPLLIRNASAPGEGHLDRELDIQFSGEVFAATCREPFLEIALPLFDRQPIGGQPTSIIDTGCGDGTLLETLYTQVLARTERGRRLREYPLIVVGVEPSPVARRAASARLATAGIPHLVIDGDIADPEGLQRDLAELRIDATDALHVSKSVIHDRRYPDPDWTGYPHAVPPTTSGAFAAADGSAIPPARMALSLAAFFRSWRYLAGRHGLVVIEAHTADPSVTARLIGRSQGTALDATHGYSCQYPVEPKVFAWAAREAGFLTRQHRELGADAIGHTVLTIDHFVAGDL